MQDIQYRAVVDDANSFELNRNAIEDLQVFPSPTSDVFHVLYKNKSVTVQVLSADVNTGAYTLSIDGQHRRILLKDRTDLLVEKLGLQVVQEQRAADVKAPMPGLVLKILVQTGQEVEAGDPLLILEAMKMENIIKSEGSGIIQSIDVQEGQAVEKNQLLMVNE